MVEEIDDLKPQFLSLNKIKYDLQYCSAGDKDKGRLASLLSFGRRRGCKEGESEGSSLDSMTAGELPIAMAMGIQGFSPNLFALQ